MWGEIVLLTVVVSVVAALIGRGERRRRAWDAPVPPRDPDGATWVPADPLEASFPVERTRREHTIGDAGFVDGFIVGRYVAGADDRATRTPSGVERNDPSADGSVDAWFEDGSTDDLAADVSGDLGGHPCEHLSEDVSEDPFGDPLGDPFDDGWDDDW